MLLPSYPGADGRERFVALGHLDEQLVALVCSPLGTEAISIISLRPASRKEEGSAMPKLKTPLSALTDEEEAAIQAGIAQDPDNPEITEEQWAAARPLAEVMPELVAAVLRRRGAQKAPTKELVSLRLDRAVLDAWRASGPGWQGRMGDALRKAAGM